MLFSNLKCTKKAFVTNRTGELTAFPKMPAESVDGSKVAQESDFGPVK